MPMPIIDFTRSRVCGARALAELAMLGRDVDLER
jgi:hypothetical protein